MIRTLDSFRIGEQGRVVAIVGDAALVQRIMEMGLFEDEIVEVTGVAPLGDPLAVRCGDFTLSLRKRDAAHIQLEDV